MSAYDRIAGTFEKVDEWAVRRDGMTLGVEARQRNSCGIEGVSKVAFGRRGSFALGPAGTERIGGVAG
ncbi:MAG TPA: hypothetical protein VL068_02770, partial [Microthrixaceae bacterium]|nr:hypothetical protein [Microthrixaceae bacterium]